MNENLAYSEPKGRRRVVIENVTPQIDAGRFAIKRVVGETVVAEADVFADGHDSLSVVLKYRAAKNCEWSETPMRRVGNDRWCGQFTVNELGEYFYTIEGWVDEFKSWQGEFQKKLQAGQEMFTELQAGAELITTAAQRATARDSENLLSWAKELSDGKSITGSTIEKRALNEDLTEMTCRYLGRQFLTSYESELRVVVDRERARFGAWYELFPRSFASEAGKHGTFKDCEAQLERIAKLGFDILYLPPIHPIGKSFRKGKNNNVECVPGEPGSPWAIGSGDGGHKSIHPELGTLEDFKHLIARAKAFKIEIALDIAFQCSPDHPYIREHPEWFRHRPDGTIRFAENPPKKYEDIVPFDLECADWQRLWRELKGIIEYWIGQGVNIFRVDNPHTKNFAFWEWCIAGLQQKHPGLIFLAEAFTRPKPLYHLAKLGFTQSYNYFPWRNAKDELIAYFTELTQPPVSEYFRASLWPNTPDVLPQGLQNDGSAGFAIRFILAATLGASYGIYGPAFELCENTPRESEAEEYLNSEKYEIKRWDLAAAQPLENLIARVNEIRRGQPALQSCHNLRFHPVDNDQIIAYTKSIADGSDTILTVVNLSPHYRHSGWLELPLADFQLDPKRTYQMHDLLSGTRYLWKGEKNYVELNPEKTSAHIFRLRRHVRTEHDFDYYL